MILQRSVPTEEEEEVRVRRRRDAEPVRFPRELRLKPKVVIEKTGEEILVVEVVSVRPGAYLEVADRGGINTVYVEIQAFSQKPRRFPPPPLWVRP